MTPGRLVRALAFVVLICLDIWTAAAIARAVGSGKGSGGIFWAAVGLLVLVLAGLAYLTIRVAAVLGIGRRQLRSSPLWRHGWKLGLLPLFLDVPVGAKYVCGTIVCASLAVDLALELSEERLREWLGAGFAVTGVLNFLSAVVGIEGQAWHVLRAGVSVVFLVVLCAWLGSILSRRVTPVRRSGRRSAPYA